MRIVCVMNTYEYVAFENNVMEGKHDLTIGKPYEVLNVLYNSNSRFDGEIGEYTIRDNKGKLIKMPPAYFMSVDEWRTKQLNELGI